MRAKLRTVAEGWVPTTHGPSAYNRGCRCDVCRERHRERIRANGGNEKHRQANLAVRVLVDGRWFAPGREGRHGERDTYQRFGCRCEPCAKASSEYLRSRRELS